NAFYVREFQMVHAAEDATRFLHHACRGLPRRVGAAGASEGPHASPRAAYDRFFTQVIEDAVAYFGSRVLYPSRPSPAEDGPSLWRAAFEKAAQIAIRADAEKFGATARDCGYRLGSAI